MSATISFGIEETAKIREALLIGLSLLGEQRERMDAYEAHTLAHHKIPIDLRPLDVLGRADDVTLFADALRTLDSAEWAARQPEVST